jgi:predicted DCC family thiol-disulfide oxidoreductase YuxK
MHYCNAGIPIMQSVGSPLFDRKKAYGKGPYRPIDLLPLTLIYDRECELCYWSQGVVLRWDRPGRIRFLAFQDPGFTQAFPDYSLEEPPRAMLFIDARGRMWEGFEAARQMLFHLPWGTPIAWVLYVPGIPWLATRLYEWIAKNRYRFQHSPWNKNTKS